MKTQIITFASILLFPLFASSQVCPSGMTFSTQAEIDNFATNYPGCRKINGNVIIDESVANDIMGLYG